MKYLINKIKTQVFQKSAAAMAAVAAALPTALERYEEGWKNISIPGRCHDPVKYYNAGSSSSRYTSPHIRET